MLLNYFFLETTKGITIMKETRQIVFLLLVIGISLLFFGCTDMSPAKEHLWENDVDKEPALQYSAEIISQGEADIFSKVMSNNAKREKERIMQQLQWLARNWIVEKALFANRLVNTPAQENLNKVFSVDEDFHIEFDGEKYEIAGIDIIQEEDLYRMYSFSSNDVRGYRDLTVFALDVEEKGDYESVQIMIDKDMQSVYCYIHKDEMTTGFYKASLLSTDNSDAKELTIVSFDPVTALRTDTYQLFPDQYAEENKAKSRSILIQYPQLSGLNDHDLEAKINSLFRQAGLGHYDPEDEEMRSEYSEDVKVTYTVTYADSELISVCYQGHGGKAKIFHGITVNLRTGEAVALKDLLCIDDTIISKVKNREYSVYHQFRTSVNDYSDGLLDDVPRFFVEQFVEHDHPLDVREIDFYVKDRKVGFSVHTSQAAGGYVVIEMDAKWKLP